MALSPVPPAVSEEYSDILVRTSSSFSTEISTAPSDSSLLSSVSSRSLDFLQADSQYTVFYAPLSAHLSTVGEIGYPSVPKLFTEINAVSLEASGILPVRTRSFSGLSGAGILMGFLDSGIDYTHPAFRSADGTSRILRLWDQADLRGMPPAGLSYGTEYTKEQIDLAIFSGAAASSGSFQATEESAQAPVPNLDPRGHGTAVAGIACGSPDEREGFTGAAPECSIAFVRLKPAKQYLRDYFRIPDSAAAYQEDDLMLGIRYLKDCAKQLQMPLVICLSLGTNQGGHTGNTPLEQTLNTALFTPGICAVAGTGNETGLDHHTAGKLRYAGDFSVTELLIGQETEGFSIEFWADLPNLYSIGLTSPFGESIRPFEPSEHTSKEFSFLMENSRVFIDGSVTGLPERSQLILLRFQNPTPGLWNIQVTGSDSSPGSFHMWLPADGLVEPQIRFVSPDADTTLVIPSCASSVLSIGTWNAYTGALYPHSGRGYTRNGLIRPDFSSPGVRVTCPAGNGGYSSLTGSCAAAALTAGAAALILEGGLLQNPPRLYSSSELKELFLRGVKPRTGVTVPDQAWGYGTMDVYGIIEAFL